MACIFCKIVAGQAPAEIVYRDDRVTAFRDARPRAPAHILIVPNEHIESLADLKDPGRAAAAADCLRAAASIAETEGLKNGYRVVANVGRDAGQSVFHLHFHLLGGRPMAWPPG